MLRRAFVYLILLFLCPFTLHAQFPQEELFDCPAYIKNYDDLLQFLHEFEDRSVFTKYSDEELDERKYFFIRLLRLGVLPGQEAEIEREASEMLALMEESRSTEDKYELQYCKNHHHKKKRTKKA